MKNLFLIFITFSFLISCKKDKEEDTPTPTPTQTAISITANDFFSAGDIIYSGVINDTSKLASVNIGSAGANVTWNFSHLVKDTIDSMVTTNPANTPGAGYITNTNIAIKVGDNFYLYLNKSTDKIEMVGLYLNDGVAEIKANFDNNLTLIKFPSTYNTNFIDDGLLEQIVNYSGTWAKVRHRVKVDSKIDAWGTIKLPENLNFQCIREKRIEYRSDSIFVGLSQNGPWQFYYAQHDTVYSYNFMAKNAKYYVCTINVKDFNTNKIQQFAYKRP
ncbi:MAG: hypothetical protein N3A01_05630 [Bacteroidales bacterium]|nr:hypothetical protein [Bacteroidales bacterium]